MRRHYTGAVRMVASAGPALGLDRGVGAAGTELLAMEEQGEDVDVDDRERLRRTRVSLNPLVSP